MRFLDDAPPFLFFTGKGGVGKTSLACACAVTFADRGKRVLLVSTDPASNVGQVFGQDIGNRITAIDAVPRLSALEIDPQAAAQEYRNRIVGPVRGVLPDAVVQSIEEQLSGACTTEIAAFDEFTALLTDRALLRDYDHVIFDTAPTGHTIRLLQLPGAWSDFLESGKGDASCLGPLSGLTKQREQYKSAVAALADVNRTRLVLVARAQQSALREVARTHDELAAIGLTRQHLVINGLMPADAIAGDPLADAICRREAAALNGMPQALRTLPRDDVPLKPFNLVGLDALRALYANDAPEDRDTSPAASLPKGADLQSLVDGMAADGHGLIMLMGKGGVGKTTMAAAIAVELARRGHAVHLTTSDPAAHLTDTLNGAMPHLTVSRIDPHAETERYRQFVLETKGKDLDDAGRALLEEDLRSPCTEEIAVFQAFSRIIREAGKKFVVMDTAPTGHTLLLLDATGAYHRESMRQMGGKGMRFTTPMMQLQDEKQTKVLIVTLAETTPVLEAANLQADLRRAGIEPWAWVINNSLAGAAPAAPLLRQRARNERRQIDLVAEHHARRWAIVPLQAQEPVGIEQLGKLVHHDSPHDDGIGPESEMAIRPAQPDDIGPVRNLLKECALPVEDLSAKHMQNFLLLTNGPRILACVAIEPCGKHALLRSLAVAPALRGSGWGRKLVAAMEEHARGMGVESLYLLTTTAATFFEQLGYERVARSSAPPSMQATSQFSMLCPATSTCLFKSLS